MSIDRDVLFILALFLGPWGVLLLLATFRAIILNLLKESKTATCIKRATKFQRVDKYVPNGLENTDSFSVASTSYSSGQRYLDGHPIKTAEDFERWRVINNHALTLRDYLSGLRNSFLDIEEPKAEQFYREWQRKYQYYRQIVVRHHLWNMAVEIYAPFFETTAQLELERKYIAKLNRQYEDSIPFREAHMMVLYEEYLAEKEILDYLDRCKRKKCEKRKMIFELSGGDVEKRKLLNRRFHSMELRGIVGQKKDDRGTLIARKIIRRKKPCEKAHLVPEKSVFRPDFYRNVGRTTVLKSIETVGCPFDVDRDTCTAKFKSLITDEEYLTSLNMCTCMAFENCPGEPCKHMVALARYLGYYP